MEFTLLSCQRLITETKYTSGTLAESWHNISVFLSLEHFRSAVRSRRTMAVCLHCVSWGTALYWLEEVKTTRSSCGTMTSTQRETLRCATRRAHRHHRHVKIVSIQRRIYDLITTSSCSHTDPYAQCFQGGKNPQTHALKALYKHLQLLLVSLHWSLLNTEKRAGLHCWFCFLCCFRFQISMEPFEPLQRGRASSSSSAHHATSSWGALLMMAFRWKCR